MVSIFYLEVSTSLVLLSFPTVFILGGNRPHFARFRGGRGWPGGLSSSLYQLLSRDFGVVITEFVLAWLIHNDASQFGVSRAWILSPHQGCALRK